MSASSIYRAANDQDLISRVTALAHQVVMEDDDKANTLLAQALQRAQPGVNAAMPLMFPVAVENEAAYETALLSQRGAPGFDKDIITDAQIKASIVDNWPMQRPPEDSINTTPAP